MLGDFHLDRKSIIVLVHYALGTYLFDLLTQGRTVTLQSPLIAHTPSHPENDTCRAVLSGNTDLACAFCLAKRSDHRFRLHTSSISAYHGDVLGRSSGTAGRERAEYSVGVRDLPVC